MAQLKLYFDPILSQPSRAVQLFIRATSIPCQEIKLELRKRENRTPKYAKVNPFMKVPAIDDNGFCLAESVAILRYLSRTYSKYVPDKWYPKDNQKMARVDEYMAWQHSNIRTFGALYCLHKYIFPARSGTPTDPKRMAKAEDELNFSLDLIENIWLRERKYISGDEITIADFLAVEEIEGPRIMGFDVTNDRPKLNEYLKNVKDNLQPFYNDVHAPTEQFAQYFKQRKQ